MEDTVFDLLESLTGGFKQFDASSSTLKAGGNPKHVLIKLLSVMIHTRADNLTKVTKSKEGIIDFSSKRNSLKDFKL